MQREKIKSLPLLDLVKARLFVIQSVKSVDEIPKVLPFE